MPEIEPPRSMAARKAAELALVRVVHHYGGHPEFVLLGGLVPSLLCAGSGMRHAGTTDLDVQVNLEISSGSVNAVRLEQSLRLAKFTPDERNIWRWKSLSGPQAVIKFELLADLEAHPAETIIQFDGCAALGAVNLRGTGLATRDIEVRTLAAIDEGVARQVTLNVTGLAGFLMPRPLPRAVDASRRTGTTSRSCYCTMTSATRRPQHVASSKSSALPWARLTASLPTCARTAMVAGAGNTRLYGPGRRRPPRNGRGDGSRRLSTGGAQLLRHPARGNTDPDAGGQVKHVQDLIEDRDALVGQADLVGTGIRKWA